MIRWWRFAALGALIHGGAWATGVMEAKDLAKMALWWLVAARASGPGSARALAPPAPGAAELVLAPSATAVVPSSTTVRMAVPPRIAN